MGLYYPSCSRREGQAQLIHANAHREMGCAHKQGACAACMSAKKAPLPTRWPFVAVKTRYALAFRGFVLRGDGEQVRARPSSCCTAAWLDDCFPISHAYCCFRTCIPVTVVEQVHIHESVLNRGCRKLLCAVYQANRSRPRARDNTQRNGRGE